MKTLVIALLLIFGGVSALYARFKRVMAETGNPQDGSETQSFGGGEAERDDDFFNFANDEVEEAAAPQPTYFTYESPDVETAAAPQPVAQSVVIEEVARPQFDLRQAVIYQTLLDNRYTSLNN